MAASKREKRQVSDMQMKIRGLISQIRCSDEKSAEDARTQLLAIGIPAVPALMEAVQLEKGSKRLEIARLLRRISDPASAAAMVGLLSDEDFDVRFEAVEGLSSLGYDGLQPLIAAIIQSPGSMRLRSGAHHVLHHIAEEGYYTLLRPLMMAIEGAIPNVEVPAAARKVEAELVRIGTGSKQ